MKRKAAAGLSFLIALLMCITSFSFADTEKGSVANNESVILSVYHGNDLVKNYTESQLEELGYVKKTYSAYNSFPSASERVACGPTVNSILEDAGITEISNNQIISFVGVDSAKFSFTKSQILGKRYYFPNGANAALLAGKPEPAGSRDGASEVPTILDMDSEGQLVYGQMYPNEQNETRFCKYVADENGHVNGRIIVEKRIADKCPNVVCTNGITNGSKVAIGTVINFNNPTNGHGHATFYTTDGSEPVYGKNMYNYGDYRGLKNPPVIHAGTNIIKVRDYCFGRIDSEISTYTFIGVPANQIVATPVIKKLSPGKKRIKVTWTRISGAKGYKIYRSTSLHGKYKCVKTIKKQRTKSFTCKKLKKNKKYYFKVVAYKQINGKKYYSSESPVASAKSR